MADIAWAWLPYGISGMIIVLMVTGVIRPVYAREERLNVLSAPPAEKPPFWDEAMEELDRLDGTVVPEVVEVPDGFYRERIVVEPGEPEYEMGNPEPVFFRHEPCRIPKTRKEIRWVAPMHD